ncbi:hypothetical protein L596_025935 [Steinernema carpocapsae]|uniref:Uncharacterized protein n=1 Tax=Steinernema carpocapsae TaxID=34508 RepID=A0A4U5M988_STECR|nr:hypothetical protein L596_025935 [Steinernema carpocapsae]
MGCKHSRVRRVRDEFALRRHTLQPEVLQWNSDADLTLGVEDTEEVTKEALIWKWLLGNALVNQGGDWETEVGVDEDLPLDFTLAKQFDPLQPIEERSACKLESKEDVFMTPSPFLVEKPKPESEENEEEEPEVDFGKSEALDVRSGGCSTFYFNHIPDEELPKASKEEGEDEKAAKKARSKKKDRKRELKKRKVRQQRREEEQIRKWSDDLKMLLGVGCTL